MKKDKPFKWTRARRRVLLTLLSDAGNLSGFPVMRASQAGSGTVYVVLAHLERLGWAASEQEQRTDELPSRRFYRLTPEGRTAAFGILRLTERAVWPETWPPR